MDLIQLRALEPSDIDFLYQVENDRDLWHLSHTQQPFSRKLLEQFIRESDRNIYEARQLRLAIELTEPKTLIGFIDLFDFDPKNRRAGVGIVIHKDYQNQSYGSQALKTLIEFAFNVLFLHQLYANISVDNLSSIQLFEKHGFQLIGVKKEWNFNGADYTDEAMYQLISPEKHKFN